MATIKSKQLNPNLTGSFAVSGSFDVTGPLTATTFVGMLSSSAQIADNISGSLGSNADLIRSLTSTGVSGSLGSNADLIRSLTSTGVSGSFTSVSESLASRISAGEAGNITSVTAGTGLSGGGTSGGITLDVDFSELTDETPTFAGLTIEGDLTARSYIISSSVTHLTQSFSSGSTIFGDTLDDRHEFTGSLIVSSSNLTIDNSGGISGSSTSTGSFGSLTIPGVLTGGTLDVTNDATINGDLFVDSTIQHKGDTDTRINFTDNRIRLKAGDITFVDIEKDSSAPHHVLINPGGNNIDFKVEDNDGDILFQTDASADNVLFPAAVKISGSSVSTGSFGRVQATTIESSNFGSTAASMISGSLGSNASLIRTLTATGISGSLGENADLIRSLTAQTISGSAGYTATLTAETISGSFQNGGFEFSVVSGSATSTGSFGRVEVDVIEAKRFVVSSSVSNITTVDISGSTQFGDTADDRHQFTGSIFIQSGSISQELYAVTNNDRMFFGRFTGGIPVSGSDNISRFATDGDGNIVDVGFTSLDEDENLVLTSVGDGLHVDDVNYWYNNKLFRMGKGAELDGPNFRGLNSEYIHFDTNNIKVKGDLIATTGSFQGEMYVKSPDNKSMYIGKHSTGIPVSGSENISRYVTGSGGGTFDIGFTTVDETGEVVFTTAGDGIYVDGNNYWYTTGHFKVGDSNNFINWNTNNLNISGTFTGDGSGLTGVSGLGAAAGTISSSAQIATDISGSFTSVSSSLAARITLEEAESPGSSFTAAGISGSFQGGGSNIISGSSTSTGSFGTLVVSNTGSFAAVNSSGEITATGGNIRVLNSNRLQAFRTAAQYLEMYSDANGFNYIQPYGGALRFAPNGGTKMILHTNGRLGLNTTTDAGFLMDINGTSRLTGNVTLGADISGSATSTGSFGAVTANGQVNINASFAQLRLSDDNFNDFLAIGQSGPVGYIKTSDADNDFKFRRGSDNTDVLSIDFSNQKISGSSVSTGSFGVIEVGGGHFTSASLAAGGGGGGSSPNATDGSQTKISGSSVSTGSFGRLETVGASVIGGILSIPDIPDVSASLAAAVAGGDNLGNHTATQDLNLGSNSIKNVLHVTASGHISGSTTSTGSFGKISINASGSATGSTLFSVANSDYELFNVSNIMTGSLFKVNTISGTPVIEAFSDSKVKLGPFNNPVEINSTGNVIAGGHISGSSTSTGSFGALNVDGGYFTSASLAAATAAAGISNVVEDTTPQLGGDLDLNSKNIVGNGGIQLSGSLVISGSSSTPATTASLVIQDYSYTDTHVASQSSVVNVLGNNGSLFNVSDQMTGSLFSVSNVSGFPIIEAFSDNKVTLGSYSNPTTINSDGTFANVSGSSTSTGSFGHLLVGGSELASSPNATDGSQSVISGSATSTGSFGRVEGSRVEAEHIHSTDDISAVDDITAGGRLVGETDAVIANLITLNGNGIWVGNDQKYITVGGGFDFQMNHRHPEHTSPFRSGQNTNILTDKTNSGLLLYGGTPGIIMESPVSGSEGFFLSGSRANLELRGGNVSGSSTSTGSFGNVESTLNGRIIGNLTELIKVTVVSDGGNHYAFEGATAPSLQVSEGKFYRFDISDTSVGSHPFRFSTTQDGSHGGGSPYTTGVTVVGTQGQAGAYVELQVTKATANHLYYYCTAHPGMGNDGKIMKNDLTNLHMVSGSSISSGSFGSLKIDGATVDFTGLPTSDPGVAGRLWNDSNTLKISAG